MAVIEPVPELLLADRHAALLRLWRVCIIGTIFWWEFLLLGVVPVLACLIALIHV